MVYRVMGMVVCVGAFCVVGQEANAQSDTCVPNQNGPEICVGWVGEEPPEHLEDFEVDYSAPAKPVVTLINVDGVWRVWSKDASDPDDPGDIGEIKALTANDFEVQIVRGVTAGANDIDTINLYPTGDHHSTVKCGSHLAGNLGNLTVKRYNGQGGHVKMAIDGNVTGTMNIPWLDYLAIGGNVSGSINVDSLWEASAPCTIGGDLSGDFDVDVDLLGNLTISGANGITSTGSLTITGDLGMAAQVDIDSDLAGLLEIGDDALGDIAIGDDITSTGYIIIGNDADGDIEVADDVDYRTGVDNVSIDIGGSLTSKGRIMIDGLCDGEITVGEETVALSLIRAIEGLDDRGSITINDDRGAYDANGTIYIGPTTLPRWPFTTVFDGNIMIKDEGPPGVGGGDLDGTIEVVGCHATNDDLDMCICGQVNGSVKLVQDESCDYEVGWSCVTGCP